MSNAASQEGQTPQRHCFVDEAGDPVLFDAKGRALPGQEGCSRFFILGALEITDPSKLRAELEELRSQLLADPYFRDVPSMQPVRGKTALAFHAKDDVAEVRREVYKVLLRHDVRFFAVVRDKQRVLDYVRQRNRNDERYRYNQNELYDTLVSRLFKNRLHLTSEMRVCFASRGKSDRSVALRKALEKARLRFEHQWDRSVDATIHVHELTPTKEPCPASGGLLFVGTPAAFRAKRVALCPVDLAQGRSGSCS
jgi:hypothetical protein